MNIPFQTTKVNYSKRLVNVKDKEEFDYLKELVNSNDEQAIDNWFKQQNLCKQGKTNLAYMIGQTTYYFSISNFTVMNRKDIEEVRSQHQLNLLKHFCISDQIKILTQEFDLESPKIFKLMHDTAKKENKSEGFYSSRILLDPLYKIFSSEDFEKIKNIEVAIEKNIEDIETNFIVFSYKNSGSFYNNLKNTYNITDEIMLNYTEKKAEFLASRNIPLPSVEKATTLLKDIENHYASRQWMSISDQETIGKLSMHMSEYKTIKMCISLEESLHNKSNKIKAKKI